MTKYQQNAFELIFQLHQLLKNIVPFQTQIIECCAWLTFSFFAEEDFRQLIILLYFAGGSTNLLVELHLFMYPCSFNLNYTSETVHIVYKYACTCQQIYLTSLITNYLLPLAQARSYIILTLDVPHLVHVYTTKAGCISEFGNF